MAVHTHFFYTSERPRRSLAARGGLARTFGSLAGFLALMLLGAGSYILIDAFANPIAAQAAAVEAAGVIIALAAILLFFLFKPRGKLHVTRVKYRHRSQLAGTSDMGETKTAPKNASDLPAELGNR